MTSKLRLMMGIMFGDSPKFVTTLVFNGAETISGIKKSNIETREIQDKNWAKETWICGINSRAQGGSLHAEIHKRASLSRRIPGKLSSRPLTAHRRHHSGQTSDVKIWVDLG